MNALVSPRFQCSKITTKCFSTMELSRFLDCRCAPHLTQRHQTPNRCRAPPRRTSAGSSGYAAPPSDTPGPCPCSLVSPPAGGHYASPKPRWIRPARHRLCPRWKDRALLHLVGEHTDVSVALAVQLSTKSPPAVFGEYEYDTTKVTVATPPMGSSNRSLSGFSPGLWHLPTSSHPQSLPPPRAVGPD